MVIVVAEHLTDSGFMSYEIDRQEESTYQFGKYFSACSTYEKVKKLLKQGWNSDS